MRLGGKRNNESPQSSTCGKHLCQNVVCLQTPLESSHEVPCALKAQYSARDLRNRMGHAGTDHINGFSYELFLGKVISGCARDTPKIGRPDVRTSGRLDVGTSGRLDVQTSGRPDIRTSRSPEVQTSGRPDFQTS